MEKNLRITDLEPGKCYLLEDLSGELKKVIVKPCRHTIDMIYTITFVDDEESFDVSEDTCMHMVFRQSN